jgi:hypothetical protein
MDDIKIPPEVVEELASRENWKGTSEEARAALAAALAAWPNNIFDHQYRNGRDYNSLILPLQEPRT